MGKSPDLDFSKTNSRFVIQQKLGSGGFGTVYKVYDQEKETIVALKVLHDKNPEELYYFKKEFRTLADLIHPNLVTLYELFSDGEECFFTMEMVEGTDFLEYIKKATEQDQVKPPISNDDTVRSYLPKNYKNRQRDTVKVINNPPKANNSHLKASDSQATTLKRPLFTEPNFDPLRGVLKQLVIGINAIHKAGKLHRDIKPPNILVTKEGRVVILDFGIATEIFSQETEEELRIVGTPIYMSPEQFKGVSVEASDWYSVGVVLYEALTKELPFSGEVAEIMRDKQTQQIVTPKELAPNIPDDLNKLCEQLLQKDPKNRPSGQEILNLLDLSDNTKDNLKNNLSLDKLFIGREDCLEVLTNAFQAINLESSSIVYVEGRSGLGKTALVRHFLEQLKVKIPNISILSGRCYAQETVPYKAFDSVIDLLSQYLKHIPSKKLEKLLPTEILALARLFPVLKQVDSVAKAKKTSFEIPDAQELRRQAFAALRELLVNLAKTQPIVIFIDDLHWGDLDSAILFGELFSTEPLPKVLFIGSYRSGEEESPFLRKALFLQTSIQKYSQIFKIAIKELSFSESLQLASSLFESKDMCRLDLAKNIAKESGGSPLFIDELIRYADRNLSLPSIENIELKNSVDVADLDKVIKARIEHLPDNAQRLLEVIAVAGQPISRNLAKKIAELSDKELAVISSLRANRLIKVISSDSQEMVETYHDRIRETIIAHLPTDNLKAYHHQLAIELEGLQVNDVERLLGHFKAAGEREKTAKYALIAADRAFEALAFDRAAQLYQTALEMKVSEPEETKKLQIKLAEALTNAGRGRESAQAYLSAIGAVANRVEQIEFQQRASELLLKAGHFDEGLALLSIVLKAVNLKIADSRLSALVVFFWLRLCVWFRGINSIELKNKPLTEDEILQIDTCLGAFLGLLRVDPIQAATFQARYLLLVLKSGDLVRIVRALCAEATYCSYSGGRNKEHTEKLVLKANMLAQQLNEPSALALAGLSALGTAFMQGEWENCCNLSVETEKVFRQKCKGVSWEISTMQVLVLRSLLMLGKFNEVVQILPSIINEAKLRNDLYTEINIYIRAGYLAELVTTDDAILVKEKINTYFDKWTQKEFHLQHYYMISGQIEILLYLGESVAALELLEKYWPNFITFKRIQIIFIESHYLRARCRLAVAMVNSSEKSLVNLVEKDIKQIEKENMSYGKGWANLIRAGRASLRQNSEEVRGYLLLAEAEFKKSNMLVYQEITRWSYGLLIDTEKGKEFVESAKNKLTKQGIKKPERLRSMYAIGKW